jgi:ferredoxin-NADP reductase
MVRQKFKLMSVIPETPEVKTFRFEPLEEAFAFKAGQFVMLHIGDESRAYSISSPSSEKRFIDLTIRIGIESYFPKKIDALTVGDVVDIDGPHGTFTLEPSDEAVFIGAGVGIAGLRSLWTKFAEESGESAMSIVYSSRMQSEIIWREEFESLKNHGADVIFTLTRETPDDWNGETGRISAAMLSKSVSDRKRIY